MAAVYYLRAYLELPLVVLRLRIGRFFLYEYDRLTIIFNIIKPQFKITQNPYCDLISLDYLPSSTHAHTRMDSDEP